MSPLLRCVDYLGRDVQLAQSRWEDHIVWQRPYLEGLHAQVGMTIESPTVVMLDADNDQRECFYRQGAIATFSRLYLKVVVDYGPRRATANSGVIVTAYLTARIKRREMLLWQT